MRPHSPGSRVGSIRKGILGLGYSEIVPLCPQTPVGRGTAVAGPPAQVSALQGGWMEGVAVGEGPGRRMWAVWARDSQGLRWDSEVGGGVWGRGIPEV